MAEKVFWDVCFTKGKRYNTEIVSGMRQNYLAGQIFETYHDIADACCHAWNKLLAEAGRINSIASRDRFSTGQDL